MTKFAAILGKFSAIVKHSGDLTFGSEKIFRKSNKIFFL